MKFVAPVVFALFSCSIFTYADAVVHGNSKDWKEEILEKIVELYDGQKAARALSYLRKEEETYNGNISPGWRALKTSIHSENTFKIYVDELIEDTKAASNQDTYDNIKKAIHIHNDGDFDLDRTITDDIETHFGSTLASTLIKVITIDMKIQIYPETISKIANHPSVLKLLEELVSCPQNKIAVLAATRLTFENVYHMYGWWIGEMSGKMCAKRIIDSTVSVGAGAYCGLAGAAFGTNPYAQIANGVLAYCFCSSAGHYLSDMLTTYVFDVSKEDAVINAYTFFGLKISATNNEINVAFHSMTKKFDEEGKKDKLLFTQMSMQIIKMDRGEIY